MKDVLTESVALVEARSNSSLNGPLRA